MIDEIVILNTKDSKDIDTLNLLYKKIFNYLVFKNKELILNSTDPNKKPLIENTTNLEKEVAAALESVIPRAALSPFVSLNPTEKVTQLCELSNLVIGIRLFNKEIVKGGTSLTKVTELIEHEARNLITDIKAAAVDTVA